MNGLVGQDKQIVFLKANINNLSRQIEFKHLIVGLDLKESDSVPVLGDDVLLVGEKVATHHPSEIVQGPVFDAAILQYCYLAEVPSFSKNIACLLSKRPVQTVNTCSPDNYRIVNHTKEEGHVAVPVDGPEKLGLASLAPHSNVTPALIFSVTETKRDPYYDVCPDVNLAVRVMNIWSRVVYLSNQLS